MGNFFQSFPPPQPLKEGGAVVGFVPEENSFWPKQLWVGTPLVDIWFFEK
jgi:hypothetical protein